VSKHRIIFIHKHVWLDLNNGACLLRDRLGLSVRPCIVPIACW
jgi:hypothetical protein